MGKNECCAVGMSLLALSWLWTPFSWAEDKISPVDNPPVHRKIVEGPPSNTILQPPNQVNGIFSDPNCQICGTGAQFVAENFVVNDPSGTFTIGQVVIWGGYFPGNTPNATDDFDITIRDDAAGLPGAVIFSVTGLEPDVRLPTGVVLFAVDEYLFTFNLAAPPSLANGTYWIEISNDTVTNAGSDFFWEVGNLDPTNGILDGARSVENPPMTWTVSAFDFALRLYDQEVVVPVELMKFSIE